MTPTSPRRWCINAAARPSADPETPSSYSAYFGTYEIDPEQSLRRANPLSTQSHSHTDIQIGRLGNVKAAITGTYRAITTRCTGRRSAEASTSKTRPVYLRGWLRSDAIASSRFLSDVLNNTHCAFAIYTDSHAALLLRISRMRQCSRAVTTYHKMASPSQARVGRAILALSTAGARPGQRCRCSPRSGVAWHRSCRRW
jgi:hypothetical protein